MLFNNNNEQQIEEFLADATERKMNALMVFNIDNFLSINDLIGSEEAEHLIVRFNDTIRDFFRGNDIIVRLGGDEFIALVKNIGSINNTERLCKKLLKNISKITFEEVRLTASIGVSLFPIHGKNYEELKNKAYQSLVRIKASGKNGYRIYEAALTKTYLVNQNNPSKDSNITLSNLESEQWKSYLEDICFKLFCNESECDASINTILEIFCLYFGFNRVFVMKREPNTDVTQRYEFAIPGFETDRNQVIDALREDYICRMYDLFGNYGICSAGKVNEDPEVSFFMEEMGDSQNLFFALKNGDVFNGGVVFESDSEDPSLKDNLEYLYSRFNVVLSYINILREFKNPVEAMDRLSMLNSLDAYAYVVDTDTMQVLYMNRKALSCEKEFVWGKKCYEVMYKSEACCEGCPLLELKKNNPYDNAKMESFNFSSKAFAINLYSWLSPEDNPGKALIISVNIDNLFDELGN